MLNKKFIAGVIIVCSITGILFVNWILQVQLQIPPPESPPSQDPEIIKDSDLELWAEAVFWQDFMPGFSSEEPPFFVLIKINITNTGNSTVTSPFASRTTIYYNETLEPLVTLNLTSAIQYFKEVEVNPGESIVMEFTNDRSMIYSPTIEEGIILFARVLFSWGIGHQVILTTPPSALMYTH